MLDAFKKVFSDSGYITQSISKNDLALFRGIVERQYISVLENLASVGDADILDTPITKYHEISHLVDHSNLWCKANRILSKDDYNAFLKADFFQQLKDELGSFLISDEEEIGYPEIYWRLVRPPPHKDTGPLHADAWFWDLGHGNTPSGYQRVKFWFSLYNEQGDNGFRYVSGSHTNNYNYLGEIRNGFVKPVFDESNYNLDVSNFNSKAGDYIIFHDKLLHGGLPGGLETRVSFEFTLFLPESYIQEKLGIDVNGTEVAA